MAGSLRGGGGADPVRAWRAGASPRARRLYVCSRAAAKPIVDIVLEVPDSTDEPAYLADLQAVGYVLCIREPAWFEHRLLKGPRDSVNLHVFGAGCPETDRMIRFRDHLRGSEADRDLYARTKRELAARDWKYMQQYADAKTSVVSEIMARATA